MVEVIERVDPFKEWSGEVKCECGSTLKYSAKDLNYRPASNTPYDYECESYWFVCPVCSNTIYISTGKIPAAVKRNIPKNSGGNWHD